MKRFAHALLGVCLALHSTTSWAGNLPRSEPEAQGVSSEKLLSFLEAADSIDSMNSLMIVRHGHVVAEGWWKPYRAEARHSLYSLSKSFTSTAVGLAIAEGKLKLHDPVVQFFPEDTPAEPSDQLKAMRVSDLLRMATGQQTEPPRTKDESWTKTFLAHPVPFKPGTHFLYNTSATYMQSAIVQKVTGQTVLDYLRPRLFEPLGIEEPTWEMSPQGISTGGYGLNIRTEDIAKFGQLYLQNGQWNGRQLVPADWIAQATSLQTSNGSNPASDWDQGYGYQFWRCRHDAYRGDGAFGQYCIVLPKRDAVIAITSGVKDMQEVLNQVWDKLLPALESDEPLAANTAAATKLKQQLGSLTVRLPNHVSGAKPSWLGRTYTFESNPLGLESLKLSANSDGNAEVATLQIRGVSREVSIGRQWSDSQLPLLTEKLEPIAIAGGWSDNVYTAKLCLYETPFQVTWTMKADGDNLQVTSSVNVGFGANPRVELTGTPSAGGR